MRLVLLLLAFAAALPASDSTPPPEFVQAVEFPYYLYPRTLWERELVWLKTIGIRTVEFSIPWNWHQVDGAAYDFTGATSPRRDLVGFIRLLRRLEMRAWIRALPTVKGWTAGGSRGWGPLDLRRSGRLCACFAIPMRMIPMCTRECPHGSML